MYEQKRKLRISADLNSLHKERVGATSESDTQRDDLEWSYAYSNIFQQSFRHQISGASSKRSLTTQVFAHKL